VKYRSLLCRVLRYTSKVDRQTETDNQVIQMIRKGEIVTLREEYRDHGDHFIYVAAEDSHDERGRMPRLKIVPTDTGLAFPPVAVVTPDQIHEKF